MEKYGTYEYIECKGCGKILTNPLGHPMPICECVKEKIASGTNLKYPGWKLRPDLLEQESKNDG